MVLSLHWLIPIPVQPLQKPANLSLGHRFIISPAPDLTLPSEIKPLCINLLGHGTEEKESLERSVTGILTRLDRREELNNGQRIDDEGIKKGIFKSVSGWDVYQRHVFLSLEEIRLARFFIKTYPI